MNAQNENTVMVNIHRNSLIVENSLTDIIACQVRQIRKATISLSEFAIVQFLEGAEIEATTTSEKVMAMNDVQLILRLSKATSILRAEPQVKIDVTFVDLKTLRRWVEVRMFHCETERYNHTKTPEGVEKFNPDTYIGQKLLLLDLREVMIGEIIPL